MAANLPTCGMGADQYMYRPQEKKCDGVHLGGVQLEEGAPTSFPTGEFFVTNPLSGKVLGLQTAADGCNQPTLAFLEKQGCGSGQLSQVSDLEVRPPPRHHVLPSLAGALTLWPLAGALYRSQVVGVRPCYQGHQERRER
jgi:hypothetical protein